ncbi:MAG: transcription repressor NadR, partial [Clostridia bacterium]|nr:transcription repressor NadR [Clostridia bacterium]
KISAELEIASRYEADKFAEKLVSSGACPLSVLTEGQHVHTLAVRDEESYEQIKKSLENLGILIEAD